MRIFTLILFSSLFLCLKAQNLGGLDSIGIRSTSTNVYSLRLAGDSLSTSFFIVIKQEVKLHRHALHSEQVYIYEGEGEMVLGKETFKVKKGELIFIPRNTAHSVKVTGSEPLKVISIQSPRFDGSDRIMLEKN